MYGTLKNNFMARDIIDDQFQLTTTTNAFVQTGSKFMQFNIVLAYIIQKIYIGIC